MNAHQENQDKLNKEMRKQKEENEGEKRKNQEYVMFLESSLRAIQEKMDNLQKENEEERRRREEEEDRRRREEEERNRNKEKPVVISEEKEVYIEQPIKTGDSVAIEKKDGSRVRGSVVSPSKRTRNMDLNQIQFSIRDTQGHKINVLIQGEESSDCSFQEGDSVNDSIEYYKVVEPKIYTSAKVDKQARSNTKSRSSQQYGTVQNMAK